MSTHTVVVSGANSGIGLSIVQQLLAKFKSGDLVIAVDLYDDQLRALAAKHHENLEVVRGDISIRFTSEVILERAKSHNVRIDTLILNHAMLPPVGRLATLEVDTWKRHIDVNFISLVHTIQVTIEHLRETHGKVIMTSSTISQTPPYPAFLAYGTAKAAMNYLCANIPMEEPNLTSLCICPGIVDTGMQRQVRENHKKTMPPEFYKFLEDLYHNKELLRPEQPAATYVRMTLEGIPTDAVGKVLDWDDQRIK